MPLSPPVLVAGLYPAVSSHGWSSRFTTTLPPLTPYQPTHHSPHLPTAPLPSSSTTVIGLHVDEIDDLTDGQQPLQAGGGQRVEHEAAESAAASAVGFGYAYRDELAVPSRMAVKERRQLQLTTRGQDRPKPREPGQQQTEEKTANERSSSSAAELPAMSGSSVSDDDEAQLHAAYVNWLRAEGMLHTAPS